MLTSIISTHQDISIEQTFEQLSPAFESLLDKINEYPNQEPYTALALQNLHICRMIVGQYITLHISMQAKSRMFISMSKEQKEELLEDYPNFLDKGYDEQMYILFEDFRGNNEAYFISSETWSTSVDFVGFDEIWTDENGEELDLPEYEILYEFSIMLPTTVEKLFNNKIDTLFWSSYNNY